MDYEGVVKARIISARFAISGKVQEVNKHAGNKVAKGELIATLDRKILQAQLDKELADYEKIRADFEIFASKYPNPTEETDKYLKKEKQATLKASVKDVELAKAVLDQCDMFSPAEGIIMDDSGITPGVYITPAGSEVKIIDTNSYYVEMEIEQKDIANFRQQKEARVTIEGIDGELLVKHQGFTPTVKMYPHLLSRFTSRSYCKYKHIIFYPTSINEN
jgi:multidrug resistance efflux pump